MECKQQIDNLEAVRKNLANQLKQFGVEVPPLHVSVTPKPSNPQPQSPPTPVIVAVSKSDLAKPTQSMKSSQKKEFPQNSDFVYAASVGRIEQLKQMLSSGVDICSVDFKTGNSALHAATSAGGTATAHFLVENGANLSQINRKGETALHLCVEKRNDDLTKWFIENGADPEAKTNLGQNALDIAGRIAPAYAQELKEFIITTKRTVTPSKEKKKNHKLQMLKILTFISKHQNEKSLILCLLTKILMQLYGKWPNFCTFLQFQMIYN